MRSLVTIAVLAAAVLASSARAEEDGAMKDFLDPGGEYRRIKAADKIVARGDIEALQEAILEIVKRAGEGDIELIAVLATKAENPLCRYLFAYGLEVAGIKVSVPVLLKKIEGASDPHDQARGLEVLGLLRDPSTLETLFTYAAVEHRYVAAEAFRALAKICPRKEGKRLAEAAVDAKDDKAALEGAWAAADVLRSPKAAAGAMGKISREKTPRGDRAKALISDLTTEGLDKPFRFPKKHLAGIEKWLKKNPPRISIEATPLATENLQGALDYLKEKAPSYHQLVVRSFRVITNKRAGEGQKNPVVWDERKLEFKSSEAASWNAQLLSYVMVRGAAQLIRRDIGEVFEMRRGLVHGLGDCFWYCERHTLVETKKDIDWFIDSKVKQKLWR